MEDGHKPGEDYAAPRVPVYSTSSSTCRVCPCVFSLPTPSLLPTTPQTLKITTTMWTLVPDFRENPKRDANINNFHYQFSLKKMSRFPASWRDTDLNLSPFPQHQSKVRGVSGWVFWQRQAPQFRHRQWLYQMSLRESKFYEFMFPDLTKLHLHNFH